MPKQINVRVSGEVHAQLEAIKEEGDYGSVVDVVRKALTEWLKDRELKAERKRIAEGEIKVG